jgi:hypothetical protein
MKTSLFIRGSIFFNADRRWNSNPVTVSSMRQDSAMKNDVADTAPDYLRMCARQIDQTSKMHTDRRIADSFAFYSQFPIVRRGTERAVYV